MQLSLLYAMWITKLLVHFQMGNNPISTMGCIALAKAINESEITALKCLDLKVCSRRHRVLFNA